MHVKTHERTRHMALPVKDTKIPEFVKDELDDFLKQGRPGSITFHSDGQAIRQAEVKTVRRDSASK